MDAWRGPIECCHRVLGSFAASLSWPTPSLAEWRPFRRERPVSNEGHLVGRPPRCVGIAESLLLPEKGKVEGGREESGAPHALPAIEGMRPARIDLAGSGRRPSRWRHRLEMVAGEGAWGRAGRNSGRPPGHRGCVTPARVLAVEYEGGQPRSGCMGRSLRVEGVPYGHRTLRCHLACVAGRGTPDS